MAHAPERAPLGGRQFEVVVIGGGINGVAIARECARGRRRTLLIEKNDFASGTTSRSTRIIHGGLRYLEHGEIGLVRESLRERQRMAVERPHLVRPLHFVLAIPGGRRSALEIRLGLWLYRRLGGTNSPAEDSAFERTLDTNRDSLRIFHYDDAQCEFPERLVAEWLRDAMRAGAVVRNHTCAVAVRTENGRVRDVILRDECSGAEYAVGAMHVINATGPWADTVCAASGVNTRGRMIGGVRGSHIVLRRFAGAPATAVYTGAPDGRPVFLVPWNGQLLFGTTEVRDDGDPGQARPSTAEIEYLLHSLRRLYPKAQSLDISYAFSGIRPLPYSERKNTSAITRRHFLRDHAVDAAEGLISVLGGKLTTAGSLARECARKIGVPALAPASNPGFVDGTAFQSLLEQFAKDVSETARLDSTVARALVEWHGGEAIHIARSMAADPRRRKPICAGGKHLAGEAVFAVEHEAAITLGDILLRRVPIALDRTWAERNSREASRNIGALLGWTETRMEEEAERLEEERSAFLIRPAAGRIAA